MKNKGILFIIIGILVGVIVAILTFGRYTTTTGLEEEPSTFVERGSVSDNSPAPVFSLPDTSGNLVNLGDYHGRVVIINFWATWCVPCKEEMPVLDAFSQENSENIVVLGINVGDSTEEVKNFINGVKVTYPILIDKMGVVGITYHVIGYPTTYFVDAEGIIRGKHVGSITPRLIQQYLTPLGINQ